MTFLTAENVKITIKWVTLGIYIIKFWKILIFYIAMFKWAIINEVEIKCINFVSKIRLDLRL